MLPFVFKLKKRVGRWLCMHEVLKCMYESATWTRGEEMGMGGKETSLLLYHFVPFDFFNHV